jgi:hypothetical protein
MNRNFTLSESVTPLYIYIYKQRKISYNKMATILPSIYRYSDIASDYQIFNNEEMNLLLGL